MTDNHDELSRRLARFTGDEIQHTRHILRTQGMLTDDLTVVQFLGFSYEMNVMFPDNPVWRNNS